MSEVEEGGLHSPPARSRFPAALRSFAYQPAPVEEPNKAPSGGFASPDLGRERNLLILLHGFGGRKEHFADFARRMALPKTAVLALDGPEQLWPEMLDDPPGFSWYTTFDMETADFIAPRREERRRLDSLRESRHMLSGALRALCEGRSGAWRPEEIFLLGYGQGGTLALDLLLSPEGEPEDSWAGRLGGVVAVASEVLPERRWQLEAGGGRGEWLQAPECGLEGTGVLMINGARDEQVPLAAAEASASLLRRALAGGKGSARLQAYPRRGGEMLRADSKEEMQLVMEFFADRLHGVGRRGSQEAMERLGAERVDFMEEVPPGEERERELQLLEQQEAEAGKGCDDASMPPPATACSIAVTPELRLEEMD